ncbi:MAG TPA: heme o synthase [Chloroflexota bacterium]|nr:heme o synthase [Chloroflexota bacterium]
MAVTQADAPAELIHGGALEGTRRPLTQVIPAYFALMKPRIMSLLLITTLASALIAARQHPLPAIDLWRVLIATWFGGVLAAGGAAALNCYIDRDIDVVMARTRRRAIPAGVASPRDVLIFGLTLSALSLIVLGTLTTPTAAVLALAGNVFYVVVYTMWLKRSTTQNIVIGGVAGAFPPLVGWAAVTGGIALPAVLLFIIVTYWTPAHFWSLALLLRGDYSRARVPMLPSVATQLHARWQILVYTLLVVVASLLLYVAHAMGPIYLGGAALLGLGFVGHAVVLYRYGSARLARRTFMYSNYYLAALFIAMIVDRLVG